MTPGEQYALQIEAAGELQEQARDWLWMRGLTPDTILAARLGFVAQPAAGHEPFAGAISIPYFDAMGRERSIRFRHLSPGRHKYDQPKGTHPHLYGVDATTAPRPYITEGEFDALILRQLGLAAVGVAGASSFARPWRWLFEDAELVSIVPDGDEPGLKAANRIAGWISDLAEVRVLDMPGGTDVTELYVSDPEALRRLLA
jgi:Toprim-like